MSSHSTRNKIFNIKFMSSFIMSIFAATAVFMYGYDFPKNINLSNPQSLLVIGFLCASISMIANLILGTYSLINIKAQKSEKINSGYMTLSFLGSIPYGFLCYFGFQNVLPFSFNVCLSVIVVFVNTGISYTALRIALKNFFEYITTKGYLKILSKSQPSRWIGLLIGIMVSATTFVAAYHGVKNLLLTQHYPSLANGCIPYIISVVSWIPVAALYANSNQEVFGKLYLALCNSREKLQAFNVLSLTLIVFCIVSGTAFFSQMYESFSTTKYIPELFKANAINHFIYTYLLIIGLLSSAAVNYLSIMNLKIYFNRR